MTDREIIEYSLKALTAAGAEDAQCSLGQSERQELNIDNDEISLLRTVHGTGLSLTALKENRKGSRSLTSAEQGEIDAAVEGVMELIGSSQPDPAHAIAPGSSPRRFEVGPSSADRQLVHDRMEEFLSSVDEEFPTAYIEEAVLDFTASRSYVANTNGVDFCTEKGLYSFGVSFISKEAGKSSSGGHRWAVSRDLDRPLLDMGTVRTGIRQSTEQVSPAKLGRKFTGHLVVTPECLGGFIRMLVGITLGDHALISGTSPFRERLGQPVAAPCFSLHSRPLSEEMADNYFVTGDGFPAQNSTLIEEGVLKGFLLSLYGSRKTGLERAVNDGGAWELDPGDRPLSEIIDSIDRGVVIARFSGGSATENGDFSGIAKNSYYIEDGEVLHPISETMVSGNLLEMLTDIHGLSRERADFGDAILPWMAVSGVTVSG